MSKGIGNVEYIRQGSEVTVANQANWGYIYTASLTKSEKYDVGDRVVTPDGRVFKYSYAAAVCDPECGAYNTIKAITNAVAPAQATIQSPIVGKSVVAGSLGASVVTVTVGSGDGILGSGLIAADELRGGFIVIGNGTSQHPQMRGIIGNSTVAATGGACNVYLDSPLTTAVTVGTTNIEAMLNPYAYLTGGLTTSANGYSTFLGVPAIRATAGQYFWLQTWGPCWISSDGNTCNGAIDRTIYFVANGTVQSGADVTLESGFQPAGVAMDTSSAAASNAPFVMLQISP